MSDSIPLPACAPLSRAAAIFPPAICKAGKAFLERRDRKTNPPGSFDKAWRFYIADEEVRACCLGIRHPSRSFPYSHMLHARSATHVAHVHGVQDNDVRAFARLVDALRSADGTDESRAKAERSAAKRVLAAVEKNGSQHEVLEAKIRLEPFLPKGRGKKA